MEEKYYIGAYWPGRVEAVETYARRTSAFLGSLATVEPAFGRWFQRAGSRAEALAQPVTTSEESLLGFFQKKHRRDATVSFSAWNGEPDGSSVGLRISCGSTSELLPDTCVMDLPTSAEEARQRVLDARVLAKVLSEAARVWDADWGVATSISHRDVVSEFAVPGTFVGWVTYFANHRGALPPLPASVRIEPVQDKGSLVILTSERFTVSKPEHVALAARVSELLNEAGLLRPLSS